MAKGSDRATGGDLLRQLSDIESRGGDGTLTFPGGASLAVSNLDKVYFPEHGITKGEAMRYYARVSPFLLPLIADRPLVLKRFPDGISGPSFYQQKAPNDAPGAVRVETVESADGPARRLVGGDLPTLLYLVQLGAVAVDPWHSRVGDLQHLDYAILDLDPGAGAPMSRVVQVARWIREVLDDAQLEGAVKLSGATGIHIYLPMPAGTTGDEAVELTREIAAAVAAAHGREATIERSLKSRPRGAVYIDYLQNVVGKPVAAPLSIRPRPGAPISIPLEWDELTPDLDPRDHTIVTSDDELARRARAWASVMRRPNSREQLFT